VAGEAAQILSDAGAVVVPPEDSAELADAVAKLAANPERRRAMGQEGRSHVERFFDRVELARQYRRILAEAGGRR
jgi:glycosyltransferase involved in cell wall biosynthesis